MTFRPEQKFYLRSMGKLLRVTAIFTDEDKANRHMARTNDAVIAVCGKFIFLADKGDRGES